MNGNYDDVVMAIMSVALMANETSKIKTMVTDEFKKYFKNERILKTFDITNVSYACICLSYKPYQNIYFYTNNKMFILDEHVGFSEVELTAERHLEALKLINEICNKHEKLQAELKTVKGKQKQAFDADWGMTEPSVLDFTEDVTGNKWTDEMKKFRYNKKK